MANYPYAYYGSYGAVPQQSPYYGSSPSPTETYASMPSPNRVPIQSVRRIEESDMVLGRVFWLPPKEELPQRAVRRAHGKGPVEEGIYNHPVLVVSRPAEEPQCIHFHIITSFQGKRLHEIYSKDNEFHASRRSWYLPIAPSPTHPDANSKKMQKRFPTLSLQDGATLRWDSYLNIRHVYKIEWNLLRPYANPDTPSTALYRFDRTSCEKMVAKTKTLTNYEPGPQSPVSYTSSTYTYHSAHHQPEVRMPRYESPRPPRPRVKPPSRDDTYRDESLYSPHAYSISDGSSVAGSVAGSEYSGLSPIMQSDFGERRINGSMCSERPRRKPPEDNSWVLLITVIQFLEEYVLRLWKRVLV